MRLRIVLEIKKDFDIFNVVQITVPEMQGRDRNAILEKQRTSWFFIRRND